MTLRPLALPQLHILVTARWTTAPLRRRLLGLAGGVPDGTDGDERGPGTGTGTGQGGEDHGGEVAEEMGHGDEAATDDAGGDFGDAVVVFGEGACDLAWFFKFCG